VGLKLLGINIKFRKSKFLPIVRLKLSGIVIKEFRYKFFPLWD